MRLRIRVAYCVYFSRLHIIQNIGAARHITKEKPKLAICTYHNNYDIWQIPRMLREMNPNYKLYMRYNGIDAEYEFNVTEFVTFAT